MSDIAQVPMTDHDWEEVELLAVELATLAGAEITAALARTLVVNYKGAPGSFRDPVSEIDQKVEVLIRTRLSERFPLHDILGEEITDRPGSGHDVVWAIDPIDGTSNFINGFPLFSGAVGVLHRGEPVVGALWCSTSHTLRPGVYHARRGGTLRFDGQPVIRKQNPAVHRRLGGDPSTSTRGIPWDIRKTGSAAIECAFVAAGLLQVTRFAQPNIWDVAGGIVLAQAAGSDVFVREDGGWQPFTSFAQPAGDASAGKGAVAGSGTGGGTGTVSRVLREWRRSLLIGEPEAVAQGCRIFG
jgi:myo-inositol-1(or 4)-monophosphatase